MNILFRHEPSGGLLCHYPYGLASPLPLSILGFLNHQLAALCLGLTQKHVPPQFLYLVFQKKTRRSKILDCLCSYVGRQREVCVKVGNPLKDHVQMAHFFFPLLAITDCCC